ncbi:MAG: exo-alpha-sialidase [bacterium]|nr:exo-alpha-sialidase [bacterium]
MNNDSVLHPSQEARLLRLARSLVDLGRGQVLVQPTRQAEGFWFGGGNVVRDTDGSLLLLGRYRDAGDSRTGLAAGPRGRELVLWRSTDNGRSFTRAVSWSKAEIGGASPVLSIEGAALHITPCGAQVFLSTERQRAYPKALRAFQKPGTGVWAIDRFDAESVASLDAGRNVRRILTGDDPAYLHVKDPNLSPGLHPEERLLLYCTHPYNWSSSASGWARIDATGDIIAYGDDFFPRGPVWDVAASRITCRMPVPGIGVFADLPPLSLYSYDGAECLRPHETHHQGVRRPRGHSCEELGGVAWGLDQDFPRGVRRLSVMAPCFVSPAGTGCNRYVSAITDDDGMFAIWQQSNRRKAQPLMGHRLSPRRLRSILD